MRIASLGDLNLDLLFYVDKIPEEGGEEIVKRAKISPGGSAANVAVALAKLGAYSRFIGTIGDDLIGWMLLNELKKLGVDTSCLSVVSYESTGLMVILVTRKERTIIGTRGANKYLKIRNVNQAISNIDALFISGYAFIEGFQRIFAIKVAKEAVKRGIKIFIDASGIFAEKGRSFLEELDIFFEAIFLNHLEFKHMFGDFSVANSYRKYYSKLFIKEGPRGATIYEDGEEIRIPAFEVDVVDTTGAGDVFDASVMYCLLKGFNPREAVIVGNAAAAIKCTRSGGWSSPNLEELKNFLHKRGYETIANRL